MRFLNVDPYYPDFLRGFYGSRPGLEAEPYARQHRTLMASAFGIADFYSSNLRALGHEAEEVVPNCEPLQRAWAAEQGISWPRPPWSLRLRKGVVPWPVRGRGEWQARILLEQVKRTRPDVLLIQDMVGTPRRLLEEARPYVRLIAGQIASPIPGGADFGSYDLVLSSFPHFVERFRSAGLRSEYFNLGFEATLLDLLEEAEPQYGAVFVGGLSREHGERVRFLEDFARVHPLDVWGYGVGILDSDSPLRARHHGEIWGMEMYRVLRRAKVVLNRHIDAAGPFANNMRLYEATGVGALLLTDRKRNLADLFHPGREVATYGSTEECIEVAGHYLDRADERGRMAEAGQRRTLATHTYRHRMEELVTVLDPLLGSAPGQVAQGEVRWV